MSYAWLLRNNESIVSDFSRKGSNKEREVTVRRVFLSGEQREQSIAMTNKKSKNVPLRSTCYEPGPALWLPIFYSPILHGSHVIIISIL